MENKKQVLIRVSPPQIPEDIIFFEIFPRLPVKSIHRFRCVSKFCRSLTSNPRFLAAVRRHSPRRYLLSFTPTNHLKFVLCSINPEDSEESDACKTTVVPRISNYFTCAKLINGITCLVREDDVIVSNRATKEEFLLPRLRRNSDRDIHFAYFCYDPETDKYKVLRATSVFAHTVDGLVVLYTRYSIFTLGIDKSWRHFYYSQLSQLGRSSSVCINGILYCTNFLTSNNIKDSVIAAYVVGKEYFYIVAYPEGLAPSRYNLCHVIEVKGALAIADVEDPESCMISLWIKSECSWMEHRIEFDTRWKTYFYLTRNFSFSTNGDGEIVTGLSGMLTPGCWIFGYNMETRKWRIIGIVEPDPRLFCGNFPVKKYGLILREFFVEEYVENPLLLRQILRS